MLARFFHSWERRLAAVTKDRVVRDFDWGLDWLPSPGGVELPSDVQVDRWVDEVMRDTHAFFTPPQTSDFSFTTAPAEAQRAGEAPTVTSPSALVTPHPDYNTGHGRWFPS